MAESPLEELEILSTVTLDLSRLSLKRLAIDSSMMNSIPSMPGLKELVVTRVDHGSAASISSAFERIPGLSLLTLSGDYHAISLIDTSPLSLLEDVSVEVTSFYPANAALGRARDSLRSLASLDPSQLSIVPNDSWTNATLTSAVCDAYTSSIDHLDISPVPGTEAWFRFPSCISAWPTLLTVTCNFCQMPNFTVLPPSTRTIGLFKVKGSWTQSDAGTDFGAYADYFDWSWLPRLPDLSTATLSFNQIYGTLPNQFNHTNLSIFELGNNAFVGTISPTWFLQFPSLPSLSASDNQLVGTIPYYGLESFRVISLPGNLLTAWPPLITNSTPGFGYPTQFTLVDLAYNRLTLLPTQADFEGMNVKYLTIGGNSNLTGILPNIFNSSIARDVTTLVATISITGCGFTGPLPDVPEYINDLYSLAGTELPNFYLDNNNFEGTIPWNNLTLSDFFMQGSHNVNGSIATWNGSSITSQIFGDARKIRLDNPNLVGHMLNISTLPSLLELTMNTPNIDFCAAARLVPVASRRVIFPAPSLELCDLSGTNANTCAWAYPAVCAEPGSPSAAVSPSSPSSPQSSPSSAPTAAPSDSTIPLRQCPLPSPGASFACLDGLWVSNASVTEEIITLPSQSATVINGNLTTSTIVFNSVSSLINITGCLSTANGSSPAVTVVLTSEDLEKIVKSGNTLQTQFILQNASCGDVSISTLTFDTSAIKSCKTIKTDRIEGSRGLAVAFTVTSSKCNTWWIIVASVLCALVLVVVIVVVVVFLVFRSKKRHMELRSISAH